MEKLLFRSSAIWAVLGLLSGVYYRELTRFQGWDHPTFTQLSTVHTHTLVLGCLFMLVMLALERVFRVSQHSPLAAKAYVVWNVGVGWTVLMQAVKGTLQVTGQEFYSSPAIAGISGLGHIILTAGFALYFHALAKAVKAPAETSH